MAGRDAAWSGGRGADADRIAAMIRSADRAVYDVGADNGNVWFELGDSIGLRQPVALTSSVDPPELVDILRTPWLRPSSLRRAWIASSSRSSSAPARLQTSGL